MKDRLTTAPLPLERPQCYWNAPWRIWNSLQPLEQPAGLLERAKRYWNGPWPLERPQGYWNAPWRIWNARRAILYCSLAGRDKSLYYLRPNPLRSPPLRPLERAKRLWNAQALLERPLANGTRKRYWNGLRPLGTPAGGLVKNHYYTRATHGIVEVMWSNRGAFVERDFAIVVLKCRMRVQNYYFFLTWQWVGPDCVRYWSGSCASACCFLTNTAF